MEPINNLSKVMQLLGRRLSSQASQVDQKSTVADSRQIGDPTTQPAPSLEELVAARLARLDEKSPSFGQLATQIFLDEVLRDEFGPEVWSASEFQATLERIQQEWKEDADIVALLRTLAARGRRD